jgi:hypothetical protein
MSNANVFIIESLSITEENSGHIEGKILSDILRLSGKKSLYMYIHTIKELEDALLEFRKSDYRYLHLSCHGCATGIFISDLFIDFASLSKLLTPHLFNKRLFLSSCSITQKELADLLFPNSGCYSILGSTDDVLIRDAAIMWASFYHRIFKEDMYQIKRRSMSKYARMVSKLFNIPLALYYPGRKKPVLCEIIK